MEAKVVCFSVLLMLVISVKSQLRNSFYASTCPGVEGIVRSTVQSHFNSDPTIAPGLLRLHFHDCFVQGCDASVLITRSSSERTAFTNTGLRGFEVIDDAKAQLESMCPGVVSCADILTLAARDAVDLTGGPSWGVPLGRRDGRVSSSSDALNLPSPLESIASQRQKFAAKGLDDHDLVTLVGAHTIGQTDCRFFQYRLYNYTSTGNSDPSINQAVLTQLQTLCPKNGNGLTKVALDKDSRTNFDVSFFKNVRDGNAVLESDQRLLGDDATRAIVQNYAGNFRGLFGVRFNFDFPKAMIKMGSIGVKTDSNGEIRNICSKFN
ncbi:peroxidase 25 [Beta vulgaris subsp. vulgaris]|uniref:peroxidase 25 n=1 Tax=Beta vulgaris subsp. vulgaris TaxID=3555 RepID=UPI00203725DC|nr:peroxidase 25 [Beta vulgaris subsp. vulgaris]